MRPVVTRLCAGHRVCRLALGLLPAAVGVAASPAANDDLQAAWRLGAQGRFGEATAALDGVPPLEEAKFTRAMLLFNRQPRADADLAEAIDLLSSLAREGSTASARARSLFFWARAETLRARDGPPTAALRLYERLGREYPGESYGQLALVHRLLLAFYADEPRASVLAECAGLERQAAGLTHPEVRSLFHQVAARGYLHLGGEEARALDHLLKVDELGVARREAWGDLQVSIGRLAAELGRPALAREHYAAFLREFPHDPRAYMVGQFLAALPAAGQRSP